MPGAMVGGPTVPNLPQGILGVGGGGNVHTIQRAGGSVVVGESGEITATAAAGQPFTSSAPFIIGPDPGGTANLRVGDDTDAADLVSARFGGTRPTPTIGDTVRVEMVLANANGAATAFAQIRWRAEGLVAGAEDGALVFDVMQGGSLEEAAIFDTSEIVLNANQSDRDFKVHTAGGINSLIVHGATGNVDLGGTLDVTGAGVFDSTVTSVGACTWDTGANGSSFGGDLTVSGSGIFGSATGANILRTQATDGSFHWRLRNAAGTNKWAWYLASGTDVTLFEIGVGAGLTVVPGGDLTVTGDLAVSGGVLALAETTTPTAVTGEGRIYTKTDNKLYFQDGAGTEHEVAFV